MNGGRDILSKSSVAQMFITSFFQSSGLLVTNKPGRQKVANKWNFALL